MGFISFIAWGLGLLLAFMALSRTSSLKWQVKQLLERITRLEEAVAKAVNPPEEAVAPDIQSQTLNTKAKALKRKPLTESKASSIVSNDELVTPDVAVEQSPIEAEPSVDLPFVAQTPNPDEFDVAPLQATFSSPAGRQFEQQMASRWFVWIGAAAVALGGLLFVRYAAQHSLFPPIFRIIMGLVLGGALVAAGEYLRRTKTAADTYIPAGLTSGGVVTAFGSIYAAYALYALLGPTTAFVGLGLVALGALALAMRQGPLIAAVGLVGSYLTPALVVSNNPQALGLFIYLIVILVACFAVLRKRDWDWLGYLSLAGGTAWAMLWVESQFIASDAIIIGLFCFAMAGVATFAIAGKAVFADEAGSLLNPLGMSRALRFAVAGVVLAMVVLSAQVLESHHGFVAMVFFALGLAGLTAFGWQREGNSLAAPLAAGLAFFIILAWGQDGYYHHEQDWPTIVAWSTAAILGFGLVGAAGYLRKSPDIIWAALAATAPVLLFFELYGLVPEYWSQSIWALLALSMAAAQIFLAWLKRGDEVSPAVLLGATAILVVFAFDRWSADIWLTLLIAGLALIYALLSRIFATRYIGFLAILLATIAELRLFLRHSGFAGNASLPLGMHWPLYGYGLPAIGFWVSSRILVEEKYRRSRIGFEGLSLGLVITLVSLEIRAFIGGDDVHNHLTLLEMAAHICAWLGAAYGLAYRQTLYSSFISTWGARILLAASALGLVALNFLALNPLFDQQPIAGGTILNSLMLAYLVPCILLGLLAQKMNALGIENMRIFIGGLALASLLSFVTLELKLMFEGPVIDIEFISDAESYAISFSWMALAVIFFITGLRWQRVSLRYGGIGVMALALFKTFGYDLWRLGGLWQIASVMGIGLSLVGIGWLYARFMRGEEAAAFK